MAPERKDYRDRFYGKLKPYHRVSVNEFRSHGLLLPLGAVNAHFNITNGFLLHPESGWVLPDSANPLCGWSIQQVLESGARAKVPENDLFGAMFLHVREKLSQFVDKLDRLKISFHLYDKDAIKLARDLDVSSFLRVDVSNIVDDHHVGLERVVNHWAPLLDSSPRPESSPAT